MASSKAATVDEYLAELPAERRAVVARVGDVVRRNLPKGYTETMNWGMICWEIPLSKYPDTYNGEPLGYVALAAQKNYYSLYLTNEYGDGKSLPEEFRKAGKKFDMGKVCLRFKTLDDLPLDVIGEAVASTPPEKLIEKYEQSRAAQ